MTRNKAGDVYEWEILLLQWRCINTLSAHIRLVHKCKRHEYNWKAIFDQKFAAKFVVPFFLPKP